MNIEKVFFSNYEKLLKFISFYNFWGVMNDGKILTNFLFILLMCPRCKFSKVPYSE